ncbi:MAG: anaerobic ribonucleoside-triphosphate reductase activating protein [Candidatus Altiarchaeales archaeon WOR_SM1_86-2]|nr:MAG: anaerobic ribonucleoside-triphosphate reductase activating protein [Candidatus Altiarchaeales archaeon WOR_SM1_86-2]
MKINFAGIVDHSTIDYPGKISAVVYLCGCPYRCPWCQNPELVLEDESVCMKVDPDEIIEQLKENFLLDSVCITGGEPLMQPSTLDLLKKIKKETNLLLKIDHNGYFPERLKKALPYLDFLTTDIKAPLDERYGKAIGLPDRWEEVVERVKESNEILKNWEGKKEARTTIVPGLVETLNDVIAISKVVGDVGFEIYTLQQFRPEKTLDPGFKFVRSPGLEKMQGLGREAKKYLPDIKVQIVTRERGFEEITV